MKESIPAMVAAMSIKESLRAVPDMELILLKAISQASRIRKDIPNRQDFDVFVAEQMPSQNCDNLWTMAVAWDIGENGHGHYRQLLNDRPVEALDLAADWLASGMVESDPTALDEQAREVLDSPPATQWDTANGIMRYV